MKHSNFNCFAKGFWRESPTFVQILGMCPTLAVTTKAMFGMSMGLATTFVLIFSCTVTSIFRKIIPVQIRIVIFTIIIATFVTIADLFLKANFPALSKSLGPYVPLIVVNCIIFGRQEAFASKNVVSKSFLDSLGMGLGFTTALIVLGSIREFFGSKTFFNIPINFVNFENFLIIILPTGAFFTLGFLIGFYNWLNRKLTKKA